MTHKPIKLSKFSKDHSGQVFGKLTAIMPIGRSKHRSIIWLCQCECGNECQVPTSSLVTGNTTTCGCSRTGRYVHGFAHHPMYKQFHAMHQRCENSNSSSFHKYGARGIKVCDQWSKFSTFLKDMGERPEGMSLDRIDNNGDYTPDNCKWSTPKEQARNGRHNKMLTLQIKEHFFNIRTDGYTPEINEYLKRYENIIHHQYKNGVTKCVSEWAEITGINEGTIRSRKRLGWSDYQTLTTPTTWLIVSALASIES